MKRGDDKTETMSFEERTERKTISFPIDLLEKVYKLLPYSEYTTFSELVRDLVRKWVREKTVKEVKNGNE